MSITGDVSITVRKVAEELTKLKTAYEAKDDAKCEEMLGGIKRRIIAFPTFMNPAAASPTRGEELMLARQVLELAVLVYARLKDLEMFQLYFSQLQVYYTDVDVSELPESPQYLMVLGLNLVCLLVMSRIAQFHSELEKIPHGAQQGNAYISFAVMLERHLMEGSYNKLLNCRKAVPCNEYIPVVEMLELTVRNEVASCIPRAYSTLSIPAAQKVLMLASQEEVLAIGREREWKASADGKQFVFAREEELAKKVIPFQDMIRQHIQFAADIQNVV